MTKIPFGKESIVYILLLGLITLITYDFSKIAAIIPFFLLLFIIYLFRTPNRNVPYDDIVLLSPTKSTLLSALKNHISELNEILTIKVKKGYNIRSAITAIGVVK